MPTLTTNWQQIASRSVYVTNNTTGYNILYARYSNLNYHTDRVYWESRIYAYNQWAPQAAWGRTVDDYWSCSLNGSTQSGRKQQGSITSKAIPFSSVNYNDTYAYTSGYFDIDHTNAWSGTLSYTGYCFTSSATISGSVSLNALFVASTPSLASTAYIGDSVTINTNRSNSNYTHTLSYSLDGSNYTQIATNVATSYNWSVPTSFYNSIPNARQINFYIRCVTTDGSNTGTTTISSIAYVKENVNKPTISSLTYTADATTQSIAGQNYVIGNFSSVNVTFTATALNSATINQVFLWTGTASSPVKIATANGSGTTYNASLTYNATTYPVYIGVTDSRGFSYYNTTNTIPSSSSYYKNYVVLSVDSAPTIKRDSQTSSDVTIQTFTGNFWVGYFNPNTLNDLTIRFRYKENSESATWSNYYSIPSNYINVDSQNNTYTISNYTFEDGNDNIDFNYQKAYLIQIEVTDLLQTQNYQATISLGIPSFAIFQDTIKIKGNPLLDYIYPVGSIYISVTDDTAQKVEARFGGTWEAFGTGRTLVGVDTTQTEFNSVQKTGGDKKLQNHYHIGRTYSKNYNAGVTIPTGVAYAGSYAPLTDTTSGKWRFSTSDISGGELSYLAQTTSAGTGESGNLQPYITCYMWKRTS